MAYLAIEKSSLRSTSQGCFLTGQVTQILRQIRHVQSYHNGFEIYHRYSVWFSYVSNNASLSDSEQTSRSLLSVALFTLCVVIYISTIPMYFNLYQMDAYEPNVLINSYKLVTKQRVNRANHLAVLCPCAYVIVTCAACTDFGRI